ncbi:hypothetical protein [Paludisphaera rhizosphaerae]|uniref:hypothetical protein n=1 Tax=Paludisphaera rhizosphaerae TaxID=2711216 RepID=UPI0013E9EC21|nr:hypothetical protein [Paludisphaera rhizosphaerae]
MADSSTGPEPDQRDDQAAAEWLLQDDQASAKKPQQPIVAPSGDSFDLADTDEPAPTRRAYIPPPASDEREVAPEPARPAERIRPRERESIDEPRRERPAPRRLDSGTAVDHVWTRGAEWGPTIVALIVWGVVALTLLYFLLAWEMYSTAMATLAIGGLVGLALLYPILITLERPVRMTPEQALRDYYQALSHHFPHYRRMWLLLSNAGRTSSRFASLEGFKGYWKAKLKQLREGKAKGSTPLVFVVEGFKSEKSGGKTEIQGKWTVQVFVRGQRDAGPIWSFPTEGTLVKGPDNMWYIDDGTLAERRSTRAADAE